MTTTAILPYQEGDSIYDLEASTKIINNSDSVETNTITEQFTHEKYSWFAVLDHLWFPQKHPTSDHQTNLSPTYHPLSRGTMVRPRVRGKPEKGETN